MAATDAISKLGNLSWQKYCRHIVRSAPRSIPDFLNGTSSGIRLCQKRSACRGPSASRPERRTLRTLALVQQKWTARASERSRSTVRTHKRSATRQSQKAMLKRILIDKRASSADAAMTLADSGSGAWRSHAHSDRGLAPCCKHPLLVFGGWRVAVPKLDRRAVPVPAVPQVEAGASVCG